MEISIEKEGRMKAVSLLYHDALKDGNFDETGFPGAGADLYKINIEDLKEHFAAVAAEREDGPSRVLDLIEGATDEPAGVAPLFLTFDDGGVSAALYTADLLESRGWPGHFFITTDYIGTSRFVSEAQIRGLRDRGHVIGSHSCSHPERMSKCGWDVLIDEWGRSVARLEDILGEKVTVASVPGGYYSRQIAAAASASGIAALFTSEPVRRCYHVDECLVLGRYTIISGMGPSVSSGFASRGLSREKAKQYVFWNLKKTAKLLGGRYYNSIRKRILRK